MLIDETPEDADSKQKTWAVVTGYGFVVVEETEAGGIGKGI